MGAPYAGAAAPIVASGTVAAPGAAAVVVTTTPPQGWYEITGTFVISGAVEALALNVALNANNALLVKLPSGAGLSAVVPFRIPQIQLNGSNPVTLTAVANATASTVYTATLVLTAVLD